MLDCNLEYLYRVRRERQNNLRRNIQDHLELNKSKPGAPDKHPSGRPRHSYKHGRSRRIHKIVHIREGKC